MSTAVVTVHQPSMTEWFAAIGELESSSEFRDEDNRKSERLEILQQSLPIPYRKPVVLPARVVLERGPAFAEQLEKRANESIAFRLTSKNPELPKLRNRGLTMQETYEQWFLNLDIDFDQYDVAIFPNETDIAWSATFVINEEAIFGEIVRGRHVQLSQGESVNQPLYFKYDFRKWEWSEHDAEAVQQIEEVLLALHTTDTKIQQQLHEQLNIAFSHDYLQGYFETTTPVGDQAFFIDFNRVLPRYIATPTSLKVSNQEALVKGIPATPGNAEGEVIVVSHETVANHKDFPQGAILVCDNTDVRYLPLMQRAAAIVTDRGGMLSHAAIITRELGKPCIVGAKKATTFLKNGQSIRVDADQGIVTFL